MDISSINFKQFDLVRVVNPNNISYIFTDLDGRVPANGYWQVSAILGDDILIVKDNTTVRIPANDVLKVYDYDVTNFTKHFGKLTSYGQAKRQEGSTDQS